MEEAERGTGILRAFSGPHEQATVGVDTLLDIWERAPRDKTESTVVRRMERVAEAVEEDTWVD